MGIGSKTQFLVASDALAPGAALKRTSSWGYLPAGRAVRVRVADKPSTFYQG